MNGIKPNSDSVSLPSVWASPSQAVRCWSTCTVSNTAQHWGGRDEKDLPALKKLTDWYMLWGLNWALRATHWTMRTGWTMLLWQQHILSCQRTNGLWGATALRGPVSFCPHAVLSLTLSLKLYWTREAKASQQCSGHKWNSHLWACDPASYSDFSLHIPVTDVAIKSF